MWHHRIMGQTIDTNQIAYVARLLRNSAPAMPEAQDGKLFLKAAEALENRAAKLTYGVPSTSAGKLDIIC
jgi:hypothetical protein